MKNPVGAWKNPSPGAPDKDLRQAISSARADLPPLFSAPFLANFPSFHADPAESRADRAGSRRFGFPPVGREFHFL
jgi:hypothetical protein